MLLVWKGGASRIKLTDAETVGVILGVAAGVALLVAIFLVPWLYRKLIKNDWELKWYHVFMGPLLLRRPASVDDGVDHSDIQDYYRGHLTKEELELRRAQVPQVTSTDLERDAEAVSQEEKTSRDESPNPKGASSTGIAGPHTPVPGEHKSIVGPRPEGKVASPAVLFWQFKRFFFHGVDKDIVSLQAKRNILSGDLEKTHAEAPHYNNKAEFMYSFLQVMTASASSFTHGANDVSK